MTAFVAVLCMTIAVAQAIDYDNLVELPIHRKLAAGPSTRITGGQEAKPHSLPYQVGLFIDVEEGTAFCGGSLIAPQWVLTAAHCAQDGSSFEVVLGAHEIRNEKEPTQVRYVTTEKVVHPDWDSSTLVNDVALLKLPEPVTFTDAIQPIRLPSKSQINETFEGWEGLESGWGKESDNASSIAERLQYLNKTIIDNETCNKWYFGAIQTYAHICTDASNGQSTCNGDSGGPLVITEDDGNSTQVGIVSFGIVFGCQIGFPSVFAHLATYVQWISDNTGIKLRE